MDRSIATSQQRLIDFKPFLDLFDAVFDRHLFSQLVTNATHSMC